MSCQVVIKERVVDHVRELKKKPRFSREMKVSNQKILYAFMVSRFYVIDDIDEVRLHILLNFQQ